MVTCSIWPPLSVALLSAFAAASSACCAYAGMAAAMTSSATADAIGVNFLFTYCSPHRLRPSLSDAGHFSFTSPHRRLTSLQAGKGRTFFRYSRQYNKSHPTRRRMSPRVLPFHRRVLLQRPCGKNVVRTLPRTSPQPALRPSFNIPFRNVALGTLYGPQKWLSIGIQLVLHK